MRNAKDVGVMQQVRKRNIFYRILFTVGMSIGCRGIVSNAYIVETVFVLGSYCYVYCRIQAYRIAGLQILSNQLTELEVNPRAYTAKEKERIFSRFDEQHDALLRSRYIRLGKDIRTMLQYIRHGDN